MVESVLKKVFCSYLLIVSSVVFSHSLWLTQALELASLLPKNLKNHSCGKLDDQTIVLKLLQAQPNNNRVIDVPVLQQGFDHKWPHGKFLNLNLSWDDIRQLDGGNCGYHALKNVLFLMNAFEKNQDEFVLALRQAQPFYYCMSVWAPMIYKERNDNNYVSWLGGQEIDFLIKNLGRLKKYDRLSSFDLENKIVVTEDVRSVGWELPVNEEMLQPIKDLAKKQSGMLGVVWTAGHGGHWVGFVVHKKEGVLKIYYMNSAQEIRPNFNQAVNLFSMSVKDIDKIIFQNQQKNVLQDLDRMQGTCDVLLGNVEGQVYSEFLGCVQRNNTMFDDFTQEQLERSLYNKVLINESFVHRVNAAWQKYLELDITLKGEDFQAGYIQAIAKEKLRCYGFWRNNNNGSIFVKDLDLDNCQAVQNKYRNSQLIIDDSYTISFFDAAEKIHTVFNHILVSWKDYDKNIFNDQNLQKRIENIFDVIIPFLKNHPQICRAINWKEFGSGKDVKNFTGFQQVIKAVSLKLNKPFNINYADFCS